MENKDGYNYEELELELIKPDPKDDQMKKIIEKLNLIHKLIGIRKKR